MLSRRQFVPLATLPLAAQSQRRRPRIAAIVTTYHWYSHADVILGRILSGCSPNNRWHGPRCELVSLYTHQIHPQDMSAEMAARAGFKIYDSISGALTLGGPALAVDGVIFIGEHGDYPTNELGQKMYPRFELFSQILDVYEKHGRALPTFFDKHLSYSWEKADAMYRRAKKMNLPWFAGSSIPVSLRVPLLIPANGTKYDAALALGYADLDAYGFHTLESLQCMVERRAGGETGVAAVQLYLGPAAWRRVEAMKATIGPLLDAAMKTIPNAKPANTAQNPALFEIQYRDGLQAWCLMLTGAIADWAFAGKAHGKIEACKFGPTAKARPLPHFDGLAHNMEELFLTGKQPYPVERTLLTTGILAKLFESKRTGSRVETPELQVFYQAPRQPFVQTA